MRRAPESWSSLVPKFKRHPALKHGAYSATALLPGESPAEFEKLHLALIADIRPTGALEENIVADMTRLVWRKQNLVTFSLAKVARMQWDDIRSVKYYETSPDAPKDSSWGALPASERDKVDKFIDATIDQVREELGETAYLLAACGDDATVKCLLSDLEIEERLDASIEKCLKRLLLVRGVKSTSPGLLPLLS